MYTLILFLIFIFGSIIGSFLNVVIFRINTGRSFVKGSSMCMSCGHKLRWFELVPILSFLSQAGKCRKCKSKISLQYPIVEFITGLIFVVIFFKFLPYLVFSKTLYFLLTLLFVAIFSILIIIFVYDFKHKIIPNQLSYLFSFLSLLSLIVGLLSFGVLFTWQGLLSLLSGPILALPFILLSYFSKGRLMGMGDGKLILGIGWLLGLSSGIFSLILSFCLGSMVGLFLIGLAGKKYTMKSEIPFAPFLIIGVFVTFMFNFNFFTLVNLLSF